MLINCCNRKQRAEVLTLSNDGDYWKVCLFLKECSNSKCRQAIVEVWRKRFDGVTIRMHRWVGEVAIKKYEKYRLESNKIIKNIPIGTKANMSWCYIDGCNKIFDFNGTYLGTFKHDLQTYPISTCSSNI